MKGREPVFGDKGKGGMGSGSAEVSLSFVHKD